MRNEVLLLTQPTRFRSVDVPEPGYRVKDFFSRQHADFLAVYPARPRDPDRRIWLSRSGSDPEYRSLHAPRLEQELSGRGWRVVQPETLPVSEQLELLATAGRVAGEQGSAFHLLVLLADLDGLEVDVIRRDPGRPAEEQNQNYPLIAQVRGLRQRLHVIPEERVLASQGGKVRKDATTLAGHLEALEIPRTGSAARPASAAYGPPHDPDPARTDCRPRSWNRGGPARIVHRRCQTTAEVVHGGGQRPRSPCRSLIGSAVGRSGLGGATKARAERPVGRLAFYMGHPGRGRLGHPASRAGGHPVCGRRFGRRGLAARPGSPPRDPGGPARLGSSLAARSDPTC